MDVAVDDRIVDVDVVHCQRLHGGRETREGRGRLARPIKGGDALRVLVDRVGHRTCPCDVVLDITKIVSQVLVDVVVAAKVGMYTVVLQEWLEILYQLLVVALPI